MKIKHLSKNRERARVVNPKSHVCERERTLLSPPLIVPNEQRAEPSSTGRFRSYRCDTLRIFHQRDPARSLWRSAAGGQRGSRRTGELHRRKGYQQPLLWRVGGLLMFSDANLLPFSSPLLRFQMGKNVTLIVNSYKTASFCYFGQRTLCSSVYRKYVTLTRSVAM